MSFNEWRQWLDQTFRSLRRRNPPHRRGPQRPFRPQVLRLEDRVTPTTYTPTTTSDLTFTSVNSSTGVITGGAGNGQVTLRSAFMAANAHAGPDTISVPAG